MLCRYIICSWSWTDDCCFPSGKVWASSLNKIKASLFKVRNGDESNLKESYPLEVQPLAR